MPNIVDKYVTSFVGFDASGVFVGSAHLIGGCRRCGPMWSATVNKPRSLVADDLTKEEAFERLRRAGAVTIQAEPTIKR